MAATNSTQQNANHVKGEEQLNKRANELAKHFRGANDKKLRATLDIAETVYFANRPPTKQSGLSIQRIQKVFNQNSGFCWSESHFKKLAGIGKSYHEGNLFRLAKERSYMNRLPVGVSHLHYISSLEPDIADALAEEPDFHQEAELKDLKAIVANWTQPEANSEVNQPLKLTIKISKEDSDVYSNKMQVAQALFNKQDETELFKELLDYVAQTHNDFQKVEKQQREERQRSKRERSSEETRVQRPRKHREQSGDQVTQPEHQQNADQQTAKVDA